jgi:ankyrin repeat protein
MDIEKTPIAQQPSMYADMYSAVTENNITGLKALLDSGIRPDVRADETQAGLLAAALDAGSVDGALMLIERGATVTSRIPGGKPPLVSAAVKGPRAAALCRALLDAGAPVNDKCSQNRTALFQAAAFMNADVCRLLIERGAEVNIETDYRSTPLHAAASSTLGPAAKIVRLLMEAGADPAYLPRYGNGLIGITARNAFQHAVSLGRTSHAAIMIDEFGVDPRQTTIDGLTMLELATTDEMKELLRSAIAQRSVSLAVEGRASAQLEREATVAPRISTSSKTFGVL